MNRSLTFEEMVGVEDDPEILSFRCEVTGIPLWSQIRIVFYRMIISDLFYTVQVRSGSTTAPPFHRALSTLARSAVHNVRLAGSGRADVFVTAEGVADQTVDGKRFNRLSDYFVAQLPSRSLSLADHFEWQWPFPRHYDRVLLHAPIQAANSILGRVRVREAHDRRARQLVELVSARATRLLGWTPDAGRQSQLRTMLARKHASMPWLYRTYEALLARVQPKLLLACEGCYGPAAPLLTAARRAGIVTAEYQHGAVSAGHDGYNFGAAVRGDPGYQQTLPQQFLGYGDWWNAQFNAPVRKVAVGSPHRAERLARLTPADRPKEDLLILSDGIEFPLYEKLALELQPQASRLGLRVVLRPHPLERTAVEARQSLGPIFVDPNRDLYASLQTAHAVVSEVSTGLFEAAGIADKLFMWDTPKARFGYPRHPFQSFSSAGALLDLLRQGDAGSLSGAEQEALWAGGWQANYQQVLRGAGIS